jgi:hypothetical protein
MQSRIYLFVTPLLLAVASFSWAAQTCKTTSITALTSHLVGKTDGTVADSKTKLMWKRCPEGFNYSNNSCTSSSTTLLYSWTNALSLPATVNTNGFPSGANLPNYKDWRLPNIKELQSIVEEQCYSPAINLTAFPSTSVTSIWSNSPGASGLNLPNSSWYIDFSYGEMLYASRSDTLGVRLVRNCTGTECN